MKISTLLMAAMLTLSFQQLSATSIGQNGGKYWKYDIEWQPMKYETKNTGFTVDLPGEPFSSMTQGMVYVVGKHADVGYQLSTSIVDRYKPPKKDGEFLKALKEVFGKDVEIKSIKTTQAKVKYVASINFLKESKKMRVFFSHNTLYWALVEGNDLSLADAFFETIKIIR